MTATLSEVETPLLALADKDRSERPAHLPPLEDPGFMVLVREVHPDLEYAQQARRARGETVHVFRDRISHEFTVLFQRNNGEHTVKESGSPWLDKLNQLAGMWQGSQAPRRRWSDA